jgi:hypothetical protein
MACSDCMVLRVLYLIFIRLLGLLLLLSRSEEAKNGVLPADPVSGGRWCWPLRALLLLRPQLNESVTLPDSFHIDREGHDGITARTIWVLSRLALDPPSPK